MRTTNLERLWSWGGRSDPYIYATLRALEQAYTPEREEEVLVDCILLLAQARSDMQKIAADALARAPIPPAVLPVVHKTK